MASLPPAPSSVSPQGSGIGPAGSGSPTSTAQETTEADNSFAGKQARLQKGLAPQLSGHQQSRGPDHTDLDSREVSTAEGVNLPSVQANKTDQLKSAKNEALKKAEEALKELGEGSLIGRALGVLNDKTGTVGKEAGLVVTVQPPPDFQSIAVFPPDPNLSVEDLKKYQGIALEALNNYQGAHELTDVRKTELNKVVSDCEQELTTLQGRFEEMKVEDEGCLAELDKLKKHVHSFVSADGGVTLKPVKSLTEEELNKYFNAKKNDSSETPLSETVVPSTTSSSETPEVIAGQGQDEEPPVPPSPPVAPPPPPLPAAVPPPPPPPPPPVSS